MKKDPIYPFLEAVLPHLILPVVIELGAHKGTDTRWMLNQLGLGMTYIAVEPDPRNFYELQKAVGESSDVRLVFGAVSNFTGKAPFFLSGGWPDPEEPGKEHTDSSSLKKPGGILRLYPWMTFEDFMVPVYTLDHVASVERLRGVDLIWADIQGSELDMLQGGPWTIARTHYLYLECYERVQLYRGQPTLDQIESVLGRNWEKVLRTPTDVLFENKAYFQ